MPVNNNNNNNNNSNNNSYLFSESTIYNSFLLKKHFVLISVKNHFNKKHFNYIIKESNFKRKRLRATIFLKFNNNEHILLITMLTIKILFNHLIKKKN